MIAYNNILRLFLVFILLTLFSQQVFPQSNIKASNDNNKIAFISDTQAPLFFEKWFIGSNRNEEASEILFHNILRENNLSALFHLGDMTSIGSLNSSWKLFDKYLSELKSKKISVHPALGNHDYMIFKESALKQFFKRFPEVKSSWYSIMIDSIAVIILNSNYSKFASEQIDNQIKWYIAELDKLEKNPSVKIIIVGLHHSPYTNSTVVDPNSDMQNDVVPHYLKTSKCRLFISGHAHAFEHFKVNGKDFVVAGGGGGVQQPFLMGSNARYEDLFPLKTEKRMFHYIFCLLENDTLKISVKMLTEDFAKCDKVYEINVDCRK